MTIQIRRWLPLLALFGVLLLLTLQPGAVSVRAAAQSTDIPTHSGALSIFFGTDPSGAAVFINKQSYGYTPATLFLPKGTYDIRFSMPGFLDRDQQINIDPNNLDSSRIFAELSPGPRIRALPYAGISDETWNYAGNIIQFSMNSYDNKPLLYKNYNAQQKKDYDTFDKINVSKALPQVRCPDVKLVIGPFADIYRSPSGRYISFLVERTYQTGTGPKNGAFVEFYDTKVKACLATNIYTYAFYLMRWSQNERWASITTDTSEDIITEYLHMGDTVITSLQGFRFNDEKGQAVEINYPTSNPSNQGIIVVMGDTHDARRPERYWLVDLKTQTGIPMPFKSVFDAQFGASDQTFYAATDQGLEKISLDLKTITLVDDVISTHWSIMAISLSPGMKYAFIQLGDRVEWSYWIYQIKLK